MGPPRLADGAAHALTPAGGTLHALPELPMKTVPLYLQDASHPQARVCAASDVRQGALFGALDPVSLARIHVDIGTPELAAETRLYARGEPGTAVYTVRAGIVRLAGRGDFIGQEALLHQPYADEAVACTPVQQCRIPRHLVGHLGQEDAALMHERPGVCAHRGTAAAWGPIRPWTTATPPNAA
jgi:hypothetical protein